MAKWASSSYASLFSEATAALCSQIELWCYWGTGKNFQLDCARSSKHPFCDDESKRMYFVLSKVVKQILCLFYSWKTIASHTEQTVDGRLSSNSTRWTNCEKVRWKKNAIELHLSQARVLGWVVNGGICPKPHNQRSPLKIQSPQNPNPALVCSGSSSARAGCWMYLFGAGSGELLKWNFNATLKGSFHECVLIVLVGPNACNFQIWKRATPVAQTIPHIIVMRPLTWWWTEGDTVKIALKLDWRSRTQELKLNCITLYEILK